MPVEWDVRFLATNYSTAFWSRVRDEHHVAWMRGGVEVAREGRYIQEMFQGRNS
jgi:hypothetical protein